MAFAGIDFAAVSSFSLRVVETVFVFKTIIKKTATKVNGLL